MSRNPWFTLTAYQLLLNFYFGTFPLWCEATINPLMHILDGAGEAGEAIQSPKCSSDSRGEIWQGISEEVYFVNQKKPRHGVADVAQNQTSHDIYNI